MLKSLIWRVGADPAFLANLFQVAVQVVLLFREETWVLFVLMEQKL